MSNTFVNIIISHFSESRKHQSTSYEIHRKVTIPKEVLWWHSGSDLVSTTGFVTAQNGKECIFSNTRAQLIQLTMIVRCSSVNKTMVSWKLSIL